MEITILYDNNPFDSRLEQKWGFSCLIEGIDKTILFDTGGDGKILLSNIKLLGIDPHKIELVFLSYDNWDDTGGLKNFLNTNSNIKVFLWKSFPSKFKKDIISLGAQYIEIEKPMEICTNVYSTGELGTAIKEQPMVIKTPQGFVIITGCAHPGIINIVKFAKEYFGNKVYLILGGFHLGRELEEIIWELKELGVTKCAPCHCSGEEA